MQRGHRRVRQFALREVCQPRIDHTPHLSKHPATGIALFGWLIIRAASVGKPYTRSGHAFLGDSTPPKSLRYSIRRLQ